MNKTLPEIFAEIRDAGSKSEKLKLLEQYMSVSVGAVISMLFNPAIKFNLPEGIPEDFKFNNTPNMSLERAIRSFPTFVNGSNAFKLELAWMRLMRSISEDEARFAFALKDKDYEIGLTQQDVHEVYPNIIPVPSEESKVKATFQKAPAKEETKAEEPVVPVDDVGEVSKVVLDKIEDEGLPIEEEDDDVVEEKAAPAKKAPARGKKK